MIMSKSVVPMPGRGVVGEAALYDGRMLSLIRRTVAKDTNDDEFEVFIAMSRAVRLDPLRKQIYAFVYHKDNPKKRQLTVVTGIDGFRSIADRTGNYRPDEDEPEYHFDEALKGETNPLGLEKAVVRVWKFSHGAWHRITGVAYWAEFAPIKDEWSKDEAGHSYKTGKQILDQTGRWPVAGRHQLAKCSEALALRKGWPDELSNVRVNEEMDREKFIDMTAAETVQEAEEARRLERIGGRGSLIVDFLRDEMAPLDIVPEGQFADKVMEFIELHKDDPSQVVMFRERNRPALQAFWVSHPNDALELKKQIEKVAGQ
jgi:phage recombination protein Bet